MNVYCISAAGGINSSFSIMNVVFGLFSHSMHLILNDYNAHYDKLKSCVPDNTENK